VEGITPELVVAFTLLVVAAAPVVWLFVSRHYKLREKELEAQTRRDWAALQGKTLDARLTALETLVATLAGAMRQQLPQREALAAPPDSQGEPGRREPIR
jgi:hypothetical protein